MHKTRKFIFAITLLSLSACTRGQGINLYPYQQEKPTRNNFGLCHGFSCTHRTPAKIDDQTWREILKVFTPPAKTAQEEKNKIAQAVAEIETYIQRTTGLNKDRAEAENFESDQDQMDCIDETINTSRYLTFLEQDGAFKHHTVADPIHRGYFIDGKWPHNTAAIKEIETETVYTVDSYYFDNGIKPAIIEKYTWLSGWKPEQKN